MDDICQHRPEVNTERGRPVVLMMRREHDFKHEVCAISLMMCSGEYSSSVSVHLFSTSTGDEIRVYDDI